MDPRALAVAKLCGINEPKVLVAEENGHGTNDGTNNCPILQFLRDIKQARLIARMVKSAMPGTNNALFIVNTKQQPDIVGVIPYEKISALSEQLGLSPAYPLRWAAEKSTVYFPCIVYYQPTEDKKCVAMQFRLPYIDMTVVEQLTRATGVTEDGAIMKELLERFIHSDLLRGRRE